MSHSKTLQTVGTGQTVFVLAVNAAEAELQRLAAM
mgnify:CR=1 FL=1